jgi:hypothetical protein
MSRNLDLKLRIKVKVVIDGDRMVVISPDQRSGAGPDHSGYSGGLAAARRVQEPDAAGHQRTRGASVRSSLFYPRARS